MLRLKGINEESIITVESFPDGTQRPLFREAFTKLWSECTSIIWNYENDSEMITLMYLVKWLRDNYNPSHLALVMPYIPNARMDRVKSSEDVFTLKYFAQFINSLNFNEVRVLDPHSDVSTALINNIRVFTPESYIKKVIDRTNPDLICYPDNGSAKRYSGLISLPYVFGVKNRNWQTGEILELNIVTNGNDLNDKNVLIVDDISSYGGTFYHTAKALKGLGVKNINLYVSHCERSILNGKIPESGLIQKVYTPNPLFNIEDGSLVEKVEETAD